MIRKNLFVLLSFSLCIWEGNAASKIDIPELETAIPNFLKDRMSKYPEWVVENKFDPSPHIQTPITLNSDNPDEDVSLTISNQYIQGISNAVGKAEGNGHLDPYTGILRGYLITNLDVLTFGGDFEVVGTNRYLGITIGGSANFTGTFSLRFHEFTYNGIGLDSTGQHLNVTSAEDVNYSKVIFINATTVFNGFTWSGQPGDFSYANNSNLHLMYFKYLEHGHDGVTYDDPASWLLQNYVTSQFNQATIEEILTYESSGAMPSVDNKVSMLLFAVGIIYTNLHSFMFHH